MHIDSAPQDGPVILGTATRLSHHYVITLSIVSTSYAWWWQMRCVIVLGLLGSEPYSEHRHVHCEPFSIAYESLLLSLRYGGDHCLFKSRGGALFLAKVSPYTFELSIG